MTYIAISFYSESWSAIGQILLSTYINAVVPYFFPKIFPLLAESSNTSMKNISELASHIFICQGFFTVLYSE